MPAVASADEPGGHDKRSAARPCFAATPEFRAIRLHTRYRRELTEERTREKQRVEKLLESSAIKLSGALSDIRGVSGRDIMDHLIAGERDPRVLAHLVSWAGRARWTTSPASARAAASGRRATAT